MTIKLFGSRILLVAIAVFILPYAFIATLVVEIVNAFRYAWQEVRIEASSFKKMWQEGFN